MIIEKISIKSEKWSLKAVNIKYNHNPLQNISAYTKIILKSSFINNAIYTFWAIQMII